MLFETATTIHKLLKIDQQNWLETFEIKKLANWFSIFLRIWLWAINIPCDEHTWWCIQHIRKRVN